MPKILASSVLSLVLISQGKEKYKLIRNIYENQLK